MGGKEAFMNLARLSSDKRVQRLVAVWNGASRSDRRYLSIEDLAEACEIGPAELFGAVVAGGHAIGFDTARLMWLCYVHLRMVEATVRGALREEGSDKRQRILRLAGLLGG